MSLDGPGPGAAASPADVRAALARVVRSSPFAHSPQLQRLLTFLVDEALAGRAERLKEYVIGLEVFSRPATYDPRVDSLVRVEARRLRAALATYYTGEGRDEAMVIEIQKGRYVPVFRPASRQSPLDDVKPSAEAGLEPPETAAGVRAGVEAQRPWATRIRRMRPAAVLVVLAAVVTVVLATNRFLRSKPVQALTERDTILVAGFSNSTDEAIFDETLKQGLTTGLEQSPFLNIVSERRVAQILKLMGHAGADRLDREQARDLCLRAGAKVVIAGSIGRLGSQYVVGLTATDCSTGNDFVHVQEAAAAKEGVLRSLSAATSVMRRRLGETLASIEQFGMPVEEATTASLEALQAYSLGRRTAREKGSPADIPFYRRALELDPNFAAAHAALGVSYMNQGQASAAGESLERAYRVRERVSERERYRISAYYHQAVTGELEKASEVYELWAQSYPREFAPRVNLALAHLWLGDYEKALAETRDGLRLDPGNVLAYTNLAALLIKLERPVEAQAVLEQAAGRGLVSTFLRVNLCYLAFLRDDSSVIERQLAEVRDSRADEAPLLSLQSDTEAYQGRLGRARALSRRAVESATRAGGGEAAALWLVNAALREAEFGNAAAARLMVRESLDLSTGRDVTTLAALASARAGDAARAELLAKTLQTTYPLNTVLARYWMPTIRAAIEITRGYPGRARAVLQDVSPYELGSPPPIGLATLYPVYLRGEACLGARDGAAAVGEFQKVIDRSGLGLNFPLRALSRLQVARARRSSGDLPAARRAYDDFFALWKAADPDVPVFRQARAERAALR